MTCEGGGLLEQFLGLLRDGSMEQRDSRKGCSRDTAAEPPPAAPPYFEGGQLGWRTRQSRAQYISMLKVYRYFAYYFPVDVHLGGCTFKDY
jgi:hypothetical protein